MAIETQHYLLLDGAQIDDLIQIIYQLEPAPEPHRLYEGTRYAELADAGPVLIATNHGSLLNQYFEKQWHMTAGVALASRAPIDELVQHLSSLVHVSVSGGVTVLFRYYDPRILTLWLTDMSDEQRDTTLGPVELVRLWGGAGWQDFHRSASADSRCYGDTPWLQLNSDQLDRLNQAKYHVFTRRLLRHVDTWFPQCLANLRADEREEWVRTCCARANEYGFSAAADIVRWAGLMALCGQDFPEGGKHANYRALLQQPGMLPAEKLDAIKLEAQRQALSHSKEALHDY